LNHKFDGKKKKKSHLKYFYEKKTNENLHHIMLFMFNNFEGKNAYPNGSRSVLRKIIIKNVKYCS
jgi:hypothetical protein